VGARARRGADPLAPSPPPLGGGGESVARWWSHERRVATHLAPSLPGGSRRAPFLHDSGKFARPAHLFCTAPANLPDQRTFSARLQQKFEIFEKIHPGTRTRTTCAWAQATWVRAPGWSGCVCLGPSGLGACACVQAARGVGTWAQVARRAGARCARRGCVRPLRSALDQGVRTDQGPSLTTVCAPTKVRVRQLCAHRTMSVLDQGVRTDRDPSSTKACAPTEVRARPRRAHRPRSELDQCVRPTKVCAPNKVRARPRRAHRPRSELDQCVRPTKVWAPTRLEWGAPRIGSEGSSERSECSQVQPKARARLGPSNLERRAPGPKQPGTTWCSFSTCHIENSPAVKPYWGKKASCKIPCTVRST